MIVRIHPSPNHSPTQLENLHRFLVSQGLISADAVWEWASNETPPELSFKTELATSNPASLNLGFLEDKKAHNGKLINKLGPPMFLVGSAGLPDAVDFVAIPFQGKQFNAKWLRDLACRAVALNWPIRLLHCDHGVVAHEIMKLASWFRLNTVREAMKQWLTEDLERAFEAFIQDFPETEIKADIGNLPNTFSEEDGKRTLIMGHLAPGLHLSHHGVNYKALLTRTGLSAFLLSD